MESVIGSLTGGTLEFWGLFSFPRFCLSCDDVVPPEPGPPELLGRVLWAEDGGVTKASLAN